MDAKSLLVGQATRNFEELLKSLEGIDEPLSWARVALREGEYLHTDGSILCIVQHIACCKRMYGSIAFRNAEIRWRDCVPLYEAIGSNWSKSVTDLNDAHAYWMDSWAGLDSDDLENLYPHHRGIDLPAWRLISTVSHHDAYHWGQIELLKVTLEPTTTPPLSTADDINEHCRELPHW